MVRFRNSAALSHYNNVGCFESRGVLISPAVPDASSTNLVRYSADLVELRHAPDTSRSREADDIHGR